MSSPPAISGTAAALRAVGRPGQRDLARMRAPPRRPRRPWCASAARLAWTTSAPALGGDADQAGADLDLGADRRRRVSGAGDREEPARRGVVREQDRVPEAEQVLEGVERDARDLLVARARLQAADQLLDGLQQIPAGRRSGRAAAENRSSVDAVDVGAAQPEHVAHAGLRGNRLEVGPHRVERLARRWRCAGTPGPARTARWSAGRTTSDLRRGLASRLARRLVEELARVATRSASTYCDDRQVGDVRHAVGGAGGDRRGDDALQARADGSRRRRSQRAPRARRRGSGRSARRRRTRRGPAPRPPSRG